MLTGSTTADARPFWESLGGGATLTYDSRYSRIDPDDDAGGLSDVADVGLGLRAQLFKQDGWFGYTIGFDLHVGGARPAAFAYEVDLYPIGIVIRFGNWGHFGLLQGIGLSGMTEGPGFAGQAPLEAYLEFDLGSRLRLLSWATDRHVFGEASRNDGTDLPLLYGDELSAGVALRWGKRHHRRRMRYGTGYFIGALYQERGGVRFFGATLGYNLNMAMAR